jgi:DNA-binding IclR family transcriptional regulator
MSKSHTLTATPELKVFTRDTMVRGQPAKAECVEIRGQQCSEDFEEMEITQIPIAQPSQHGH